MKRFGHEVFTPGLARTKPLYNFYVNWVEQSKIPVITIAGTNGKGESAYSLEWLLFHEKFRSALWTSPHIESITERFSFDRNLIPLDILSEVCEEFFKKIEQLDYKVSFYEFFFLIFLELSFRHYKTLDEESQKKFVLILEVGLGGRLDAVNHFSANIVCLTSISRDHREILGNQYRQILNEKCGVLRNNAYLLSSLELAYLREELSLILKNYQGIFHVDLFQQGLVNSKTDYSDRNRILAFEAMAILLDKFFSQRPVNTLTYYLENWPNFKGRSEVLFKNEKKYIFIGAHNVDGMRKLVERYQQKSDQSYVVLSSFSKRDLREVEQMLCMLNSLQKKIVVTSFEHPKAFDAKELEDLVQDYYPITFKNS